MWQFVLNMFFYGIPFIVCLIIAIGLTVLLVAIVMDHRTYRSEKQFHKLITNPDTVWHKIERYGDDYDERYTFRLYDSKYSHYTLLYNRHDNIEYKTNRLSKTLVSYAPLRELFFTKIFNNTDGEDLIELAVKYEFSTENVTLNNRTLLAIIADPEVIPVMTPGSNIEDDNNTFILYSDNKEKIVSYKLKS